MTFRRSAKLNSTFHSELKVIFSIIQFWSYIFIIIIIIIIIIVVVVVVVVVHVITLMLVIYNFIPQTNHVSRIYTVAAVLYLQFVLHVMSLRQ